jgi:hypothetical protein
VSSDSRTARRLAIVQRIVRQVGPPLDSLPERSIYDVSFLVDAGLLRLIGPGTHPLVRATPFGVELALSPDDHHLACQLVGSRWWRRRRAGEALRVLAGMVAYDGPRKHVPLPEG